SDGLVRGCERARRVSLQRTRERIRDRPESIRHRLQHVRLARGSHGSRAVRRLHEPSLLRSSPTARWLDRRSRIALTVANDVLASSAAERYRESVSATIGLNVVYISTHACGFPYVERAGD